LRKENADQYSNEDFCERDERAASNPSGQSTNTSSAMLYHSLIIGFVCYALIGVGVATFGPVRRHLDEAVADLREAPASDDDSDTRSVPITKILLFRVVLSLAVVLLWSRFLVFALKDQPGDSLIGAHEESKPRAPAEI
jgi:hypothetical protein